MDEWMLLKPRFMAGNNIQYSQHIVFYAGPAITGTVKYIHLPEIILS